jgi:hypothetical protein
LSFLKPDIESCFPVASSNASSRSLTVNSFDTKFSASLRPTVSINRFANFKFELIAGALAPYSFDGSNLPFF